MLEQILCLWDECMAPTKTNNYHIWSRDNGICTKKMEKKQGENVNEKLS